jgi:hypothetical protein
MWLAIAAGSVSMWADAAQPGPALLERVQAFAERYQREAPSLVVEEHYLQNVIYPRARPEHRVMTSELVMVRLPGTAGWVMLRDVLVVDKRRIRDREERLLKLLQSPQADAFARASELARESARFNLGRITRTINVPDLAIEYLLPRHTARVQFDAPRSATIDGTPVGDVPVARSQRPQRHPGSARRRSACRGTGVDGTRVRRDRAHRAHCAGAAIDRHERGRLPCGSATVDPRAGEDDRTLRDAGRIDRSRRHVYQRQELRRGDNREAD